MSNPGHARITPKQERFAREFMVDGNASRAYRVAYNAGNMKPASVTRAAVAVLQNDKVASLVRDMKAERDRQIMVKHQVTALSISRDLDTVFDLAIKGQGPLSVAVQAKRLQAELGGFLTQKQEVTHRREMSTDEIRLAIMDRLKANPELAQAFEGASKAQIEATPLASD